MNEIGQVNNKFVRVNKIATVFGKENIEEYLSKELGYNNFVRVKRKTSSPVNGTALIAGGYKNDVSDGNIPQDNQNRKSNSWRGTENIVEHALIQQENETLRKQVAELKQEFKSNKGYKASIPASRKAARTLAESYSVDLAQAGHSVSELGDKFADWANRLARNPEGSYADVRAEATNQFDSVDMMLEMTDILKGIEAQIRNEKPVTLKVTPDLLMSMYMHSLNDQKF